MNNLPREPEVAGLDEYQRLVALLDERRFDEAQVRGRVLLEGPEAGLLTRAKTHNLLCWTFVEGLKHASPEAVLHGEEAVRLAERLGEWGLHIQALCNLASARYQMSDYEGCAAVYREILARLTANPSLLPFGQVLARQGLAQLDLIAGRPREALAHLEEAESLCRHEDCRFLLADVWRRKALAWLKLEQPEQAAHALSLIDESVFAGSPRSLWWKTHMQFTRARVELGLGHWVTARSLAVNTMALARELGDLPVMAECTCLLAKVDQLEGRRDAPRRARAALTYAIHSGRRDVVEDVRERVKDLLSIEL